MSAQHTPGPWMVLPSVDRGQFCILTEHGNRIDIAVTYGFDATPREANARLIAAAPDLLAACKAMVEYQRLIDSDAPTGLLEAYGNSFESAAAAVAKALGSTQ